MFKKYPFIKQESYKDCGLACTMMIIKYYRGYVARNKLSEMLKLTKNGITAYHIVNTLNELGFNAKGIKQDKLNVTSVPFIAHMIIDNSYYHYVTVYKVTNKYILLADPADKIKKVSFVKFYEEWTGINIVMHPVKPIDKIKNTNYLHTLKDLITPNIKLIFKIAFISIIMTLSAVISTFFFQAIIDDINGEHLKTIYIVFLILILIKILTTYIRNKLLINLTNNFDNYLTKNTFKHIIELPYLYYHNHTTGEIVSKINDLAKAKDTLTKVLLIIMIDIPLTIFSAISLLSINSTLFLIILTMFLFYIVIVFSTRKKLNYQTYNNLKQKAEINSYMTESISAFETIKGINAENSINQTFIIKYNDYLQNSQKLNNFINKILASNDIISNIGQVLIIIVGLILVQNNELSLGMFITYNILTNLFLEPVRNIIDLNFEIKEAINSIRRVLDLYEDKQEKNEEDISLIRFENLSFTFDDQKYALKNINLTIIKGEKILITGKSGSGKSTLVKLIKGYYANYEGKLLINEKVATNNTSINLISQHETIFTGTILDNITLKGNKDLKNIKKISILEEIIRGYHLKDYTLLEENGLNISGGQRQRIALARALQNFNLLIIDEGFSGLDIDLERRLLKNLFNNYSNKTIIVISHRLNNLDLFDRFIKLDNGKIILDEKRKDH